MLDLLLGPLFFYSYATVEDTFGKVVSFFYSVCQYVSMCMRIVYEYYITVCCTVECVELRPKAMVNVLSGIHALFKAKSCRDKVAASSSAYKEKTCIIIT